MGITGLGEGQLHQQGELGTAACVQVLGKMARGAGGG